MLNRPSTLVLAAEVGRVAEQAREGTCALILSTPLWCSRTAATFKVAGNAALVRFGRDHHHVLVGSAVVSLWLRSLISSRAERVS